MANTLKSLGIKAEAFTGENNTDGSAAEIIEKFQKKNGSISVLCCTTGEF